MTKPVSQSTKWRRAHPERAREITNKWYAANKAARNAEIKRYKLQKYGLTPKTFDELLEKYHNACAICLRSFSEQTPACVDHCHATGIVRGALCHQCNLALGNARDCPTVLRLAAAYLERERGT